MGKVVDMYDERTFEPDIYTGSWTEDGVTHIEISDLNDLYDCYFVDGRLVVRELVF